MKRKIISIIFAALLLLSISGCQESEKNNKTIVSKPPSVTTTKNTESSESVQFSDDSSESITESEAEDVLTDPVSAESDNDPSASTDPVYDESAVTIDEEVHPRDFVDESEVEFIGAIESILKNSDTIEGMYQAIEEFDTENRIDEILITYGGVSVTATEGELKQGSHFTVYYDDESWFTF